MWCTTCRQEAPGVDAAIDASTAPRSITEPCCVQCGKALESLTPAAMDPAGDHNAAAVDDDDSSLLPYSNPLAGFDSWEIEQKLLHIERVLATGAPANNSATKWTAPLPETESAAVNSVTAGRQARPTGHWLLTTLAWTALAAGVCGFSCGSVLAGCSLWTHRSDLWALALPAMVVGQAFLLLGLLLQMDVFARRHWQTAEQLNTVDARIGSLTQRLHGPHSSRGAGAPVGATLDENRL